MPVFLLLSPVVWTQQQIPPPQAHFLIQLIETHTHPDPVFFWVCVPYPNSLPRDAHSSHWYFHTIQPHKKTHGNTILRLPYTLLHVCMCIILLWQGTDKRQCCSLEISMHATIHTHTLSVSLSVSPPITGLNGFPCFATKFNAGIEAWPSRRANRLHSHNHWLLKLVWGTSFCYLTVQIFQSVTHVHLIIFMSYSHHGVSLSLSGFGSGVNLPQLGRTCSE